MAPEVYGRLADEDPNENSPASRLVFALGLVAVVGRLVRFAPLGHDQRHHKL